MRDGRTVVRIYIGAVTAVGLVVFGALMVRTGPEAASQAFGRLWPFTVFVVLGQLLPLRIPREGGDREVAASPTFAFALLLAAGVGAATLAMATAGAIAGLLRRRPIARVPFDVARYTMALASAGVVLGVSGAKPPFSNGAPVDGTALLSVLLAAVAYFVVNGAAAGVASALGQGMRLPAVLRRELPLRAGAAAVLLALSPLVVVAAERSLWMVSMLGLSMAIAYHGIRVWMARDLGRAQIARDALTGLPNRALFYQQVRESLEEGQDRGPFAVMIIDLDRFKEVNDTLGHHAGDALLRQIGPRMRSVLRDRDVIARLGGDEFAVLIPQLSSDASAMRVAERIQEALETPFIVEGLSLHVDASIGIALHPDHGASLDDLMRRADVAMYTAKDSNSAFEVYAPERDRHSLGQLALLGELRTALDEGQLVLHYQPKAELRTGRVVSVEALVRWNHPRHGMMSPDKFIPLAERTGMMRPLTLFVLNTALQQCREWHAMGQSVGVAVNLSARNLLDLAFPDEVKRLLSSWDVPPAWLELEITESAVMVDPSRATHVLARLSELGVGVSLDDFGTGYSSLAYLKQLPVNEVKIDKSFITHMTDEQDDALIVASTIELARSLGLRVVAEGVETEEVWQLLGRLGCDMAQGYHLSRPMPAIDLTNWLAGTEPRTPLRVAN